MCNKIQIICCSVSELNSPPLSKTESSFMCYGRCDLRKSRYRSKAKLERAKLLKALAQLFGARVTWFPSFSFVRG